MIKHIIWNLKKKVFCSYRYHSIATACHPQHLLPTYTNSQFSTHNAMASVGNYKSSSHKTRPLLGRWWEIRSPSSIFIDLSTQNMWTQRSFKALRIKDPRMCHHITEEVKLLANEFPSNLIWISYQLNYVHASQKINLPATSIMFIPPTNLIFSITLCNYIC